MAEHAVRLPDVGEGVALDKGVDTTWMNINCWK